LTVLPMIRTRTSEQARRPVGPPAFDRLMEDNLEKVTRTQDADFGAAHVRRMVALLAEGGRQEVCQPIFALIPAFRAV